MFREAATGNEADVQVELPHTFADGGGRDRVAAARAVLEQEVNVLAGLEDGRLVGRQADGDQHDVWRYPFEMQYAARQTAHREGFSGVQFADFDAAVADGFGRAQQRLAGALVVVAEVGRVDIAEINLALLDGAAAGIAGT